MINGPLFSIISKTSKITIIGSLLVINKFLMESNYEEYLNIINFFFQKILEMEEDIINNKEYQNIEYLSYLNCLNRFKLIIIQINNNFPAFIAFKEQFLQKLSQ